MVRELQALHEFDIMVGEVDEIMEVIGDQEILNAADEIVDDYMDEDF